MSRTSKTPPMTCQTTFLFDFAAGFFVSLRKVPHDVQRTALAAMLAPHLGQGCVPTASPPSTGASGVSLLSRGVITLPPFLGGGAGGGVSVAGGPSVVGSFSAGSICST